MTEGIIDHRFGECGGCTHRVLICGACLTAYCETCRDYRCPHEPKFESSYESELRDIYRIAAAALKGDADEP